MLSKIILLHYKACSFKPGRKIFLAVEPDMVILAKINQPVFGRSDGRILEALLQIQADRYLQNAPEPGFSTR